MRLTEEHLSQQPDTIPEVFALICLHVTDRKIQVDSASDYMVEENREDKAVQIKEEFARILGDVLTQDISEETTLKNQNKMRQKKYRLKPKNSFQLINLDIESRPRLTAEDGPPEERAEAAEAKCQSKEEVELSKWRD